MKRVPSQQTAVRKPHARTRVTNGRSLLPDVDGRSVWARRMRDIMALHIADRGGPEAVTEAELSVIRRIAVITVELETIEQAAALDGHASQRAFDLYMRGAGHLTRMLRELPALATQRPLKDVTPSVRDFIEANS